MLLQAKEFYAEHQERPFFGGLVQFMTSGETVLMILQKDNAIKDWRAFMGPTNSLKVRVCVRARMWRPARGPETKSARACVARRHGTGNHPQDLNAKMRKSIPCRWCGLPYIEMLCLDRRRIDDRGRVCVCLCAC